MTLDELKRTREFALLNDQEQAFLLQYIANGFNVAGAAAAAFNTGSAKSATVYGRRVLGRARIQAALTRWAGVEEVPDHEIIEGLRAAIKQDLSPNAKVAALRLAAEMKGWLAKKGEQDGTAAPQYPKELMDVLADRLAEMPVGRILDKLGVKELTFNAQSHEERAQEETPARDALPNGSAATEQPEGGGQVQNGDEGVRVGQSADKRGQESDRP